jgi:hypothetical protein
MEFYERVVSGRKLEGIVIKPDFALPEYAPSLKARGENYLHIIYGYDYMVNGGKYTKLLRSKSIRQKLRLSIEEYKLGVKMLTCKHLDINIDNREYTSNLVELLYMEGSEESLDKAL